jgi:hypothetical protein
MRRIFVPFRQSVIAFRLQIGLSIYALIELGVMPPSVIHPPGGTSIAKDEAPWLQRYTLSPYFGSCRMKAGVHSSLRREIGQ